MSKKPNNINTATKDEFMTIIDRREKRSGMIIKERSKAALNLESLKLINGVPSHIWDPLVMIGRITFEIDETEPVREDNRKQLMEKYKTEVPIIKQADVTNTMELRKANENLQANIDTLQSELTAITRQNELLADKLSEGEESMSRLTEALRTQESKYEQEREEELHRQNEHYQGQISQLNGKMYELKTEREQLMQKVDAQSNYIEKADATAKAQAKQLLDQNKRIKQLEEDIQHVKTTKMIDKLAPNNIYGPRIKGPHMSEEEKHSKKESDDNL
jgi:chromosome segregation ATPase